MRKVAILFLMLIATKGMSQSTSSVVDNRWKIGFQFSTDLNLIPEYIGEGSGYSDLKPRGLNYTSGITIQMPLNQRWQLLSGLMYSDKDFSGTAYCHSCDMIGQPDYPLQLRYLEVPIIARYALSAKKNTMFTEFGFNNSYKVKSPEVPWLSDEQINKYILSAHIGAGGTISLGKGFELNLTGSYRHSLTKFLAEQDFKLKSFSLTTTLAYRL